MKLGKIPLTGVKTMKVTLKSVKFMESLSEETNCFSATVYINGKRVGTAENRGCGGPTSYSFTDRKLEGDFEAYAKTLPDVPTDFGAPLKMGGEFLIDTLFEVWLKSHYDKKEAARFARFDKKYKAQFAASGCKTIRVTLGNSSITWLPCKSNDDAPARVEAFKVKNPKETIKSWKVL